MPQAVIGAIISGAVSAGVAWAVGTAVTATALWTTFAISATLSLAGSLLAPKPDFGAIQAQNNSLQDRKQMIREPLSSRRIVYGRTKATGTILFIETAGTDNNDLYMIIGIAGHEIDGVDRIYIGDTPVAFVGDVTTGLRDAHASSDFSGKLSVKVLTGTTTQALPSDFTSNTELVSGDKFKGIACICAKLTFDRDIYPNGIPTISAIFRGKKVYDLNRSGTHYSNNPAYIFRDYIKDTQYGLSVADSELDDTQLLSTANVAHSWVAHRDDNDNRNFTATATSDGSTNHYVHDGSTVALHDGDAIVISGTTYYVLISDGLMLIHNTTRKAQSFRLASTQANWKTRNADVSIGSSGSVTCQRTHEIRYGCDGTLLSSASHKDNITSILTSSGGTMTYTGGVFRMAVSSYIAPSVTLGDDDFVGTIDLYPKAPRRDRFNGVKGIFIGPENNWQGADFPAFQQTSFSNSDGQVIYRDFTQNFCISGTQAQRVAKTVLFQSRNEITMRCTVNLKGLQLIPNDRVSITNTRFGFSNQIFKVTDIAIGATADTGIGVSLTLREDTSQAYDFSPTADTVVVDPTPDTTLPTFRSANAPSSVSLQEQTSLIHDDGTSISSAKVTFTNSSQFISHHSLILSESADNSSFTVSQFASLTNGNVSHVFNGLVAGRYYKVLVTAVSIYDVASTTVTSSTIQIGGDSVAPSAFSALTATAGNASAKLAWTNPSDKDYARAEFFRSQNTTTMSSSTTPSFYVNGSAGKEQVVYDGGKTNGTTFRYWIRAVDHSGNASDWFPNNTTGTTVTPSASANFTSAEELSNDGAIHGAKLAVSELSALTATIGLLRTATSGARMEVHSDKIKVFDSSGNERVRLGNLS